MHRLNIQNIDDVSFTSDASLNEDVSSDNELNVAFDASSDEKKPAAVFLNHTEAYGLARFALHATQQNNDEPNNAKPEKDVFGSLKK